MNSLKIMTLTATRLDEILKIFKHFLLPDMLRRMWLQGVFTGGGFQYF